MRRSLFAIVIVLVLGGAAGGSTQPSAPSGSPSCRPRGASPSLGGCTTNPPVKTPETLAVGTSFPYYEPFKSGPKDDPTGFEGDLAKDVAHRMGLSQVKWVVGTFESLYAPGPKSWDLAMDEISIKPERAKVV